MPAPTPTDSMESLLHGASSVPSATTNRRETILSLVEMLLQQSDDSGNGNVASFLVPLHD